MFASQRVQGLVIVGAGPAGLAPLFAAANAGRLDDLLEQGVTILERSHALGAGSLGDYAIHSDSSAEALLDIVLRAQDVRLASLRRHPVTQALLAFGKASAPLTLVSDFLALAGSTICRLVAQSRRGRVLQGVTALCVRRSSTGLWRTRWISAAGETHETDSANVLLATGADQPRERLFTAAVAGTTLLPAYEARLLQSGLVLSEGGLALVAQRLRGKPHPRVAIVGGSTSAASVVLRLLMQLPQVEFGPASVALLHRGPLRIFYETAAEAHRDGYRDFTPEDICPLTGRVYRLSGFRLDSRELMMRALGIAGRPPEPRLQLIRISPETEPASQRSLAEADLIIPAMGYKPRLLPILDHSMKQLDLRTPTSKQWALVDQRCRLLTSEGKPLPGLFAMGLAVGPAADRQFGGETGFHGQVNSLWMWQHTLGRIVVDQILRSRWQPLRPSSPALRTDQFSLTDMIPEGHRTVQPSLEVAGAA